MVSPLDHLRLPLSGFGRCLPPGVRKDQAKAAAPQRKAIDIMASSSVVKAALVAEGVVGSKGAAAAALGKGAGKAVLGKQEQPGGLRLRRFMAVVKDLGRAMVPGLAR